jgi:diaminohydroxyphosphoribosylaminopyrimidine deaminase/5-amino-6-(5-phosphoribosylamino)uracil reductase
MRQEDEKYMQLALQLARVATGQTSPNPMVGAVVVNDSQVVGMGAHLKAGEAHAEVHALEMAGDKCKEASIYVTLEPCSHYGRTPPCAEAVIAAGIKRVVIAAKDPNPKVSGSGIEKLKKAGLEVTVGVCEQEAVSLNEVFNHYIVNKTPFITLKTATTLDGKIATITGESKWITGEEARVDVHRLRHQQDAILVGINTILADNPQLTTRLPNGKGKNPVRVILDSQLKTPLDAQITDTTVAPTWIFTSSQASTKKQKQLEEKGVRIWRIPSRETQIDMTSQHVEMASNKQSINLQKVLSLLGDEGVASLLIEGGGLINASFLQERLVHKLVIYLAPMLMGGEAAPGSFRGEGFKQLSETIRLHDMRIQTLGQDIKIVGYPI